MNQPKYHLECPTCYNLFWSTDAWQKQCPQCVNLDQASAGGGEVNETEWLQKRVEILSAEVTRLTAETERLRGEKCAMAAEARWIPTAERLPAQHEVVWVVPARGMRIPLAISWHDGDEADFTHWRELPSLPEETIENTDPYVEHGGWLPEPPEVQP